MNRSIAAAPFGFAPGFAPVLTPSTDRDEAICLVHDGAAAGFRITRTCVPTRLAR